MKPISILLVEDHAVVREGICRLLGLDPDFEVIGEVGDGRAAVAAAISLRPDVVLMDIAMPLLNGLEATRQIVAAMPAARILILSAHGEDAYVQQAIAAGAVGFLLKQTSVEELSAAIHHALAGRSRIRPMAEERRVAPGTESMRRTPMASLTTREREVLQMIAEGHGNKAIAVSLAISIKTVEKHREHLMAKLDIHDIAGLTRHAIEIGMITSALQVTILGPGEG
ncbi:MAG: response regulator transcription factor [Planctomycetota bacterium]|jgi:DNA-binding NarL/FixJ family response regulator|nr:response regulator transcription factor [Planctomycetota bacterium]